MLRFLDHYRRIYMIVSMAIRFYRQVWWFEKRVRMGSIQNVNEAWEQLTAQQAREYREVALRLQGLTIKVGQFLSTRADVMPQGFIRELRSLTDRVPAMPFDLAKQVIEQEWTVPYHQYLSELSTQPVAAASIADVYRGVLKDGTEVAVKIQRDGIERVLRADFQAIRIVIGLIKRFTNWGKWTDFDRLYSEFVQIVSRELDFVQERKHAKRFEKVIQGLQGIAMPTYIDRLITRRVLVMTWIDGKPITDSKQLSSIPYPRQEINQRLLRSFFQQIFEEGFFHADPHPGNLLLTNDGTIYWLDFGMMSEIRSDEMQAIRKGVISLILRRFNQVADSLEQLQFLTAQADKAKLTEVIRLTFELYTEKNMTEIDQATLEELLQMLRTFVQNQPIQLPAQYAFLGRSFSLMSGVLSEVDPNVDFFELGRPIIEPWLNNEKRSDIKSETTERSRDWLKDLLSVANTTWSFVKPSVEPLKALLELPNEIKLTLQSIRTKEYDQMLLRQIDADRAFWRKQISIYYFLVLMLWISSMVAWIWVDLRLCIGLFVIGLFSWFQAWRMERKLKNLDLTNLIKRRNE